MKSIIILFLFSLFTQLANAEGKTANKDLKILFLGDSLTEGYGLSKEDAYPTLFQKLVKERLKKDVQILNGSVSGSTTSSAMSRLRWFIRQKPDLLFLALGANDGLRGISIDVSRKNLEETIVLAQAEKIEVVLAGMLLPTNYGEDYRGQFQTMFEELSKKYKLKSLPFLLEGVAAVKDLNQADGIHPNEKGHAVMAETVYQFLKDQL